MRHARRTILALTLVATSHALAQGCGPTRLKVAESVTLDVPPAKAWAIVGDFQDMSWDGEAAGATGSGGNVPDEAKRVLALKGGAHFGESLMKYDATAMSYSWHIDQIDLARLPAQNVSATLEVLPAEDGRSIVRWKAAFYRNLAPGEGAPDEADAAAVAAMKRYLHASLDGLKAAPRS